MTGLELLIGSVSFAQKGVTLWSDDKSFYNWEIIEPTGVHQAPHFSSLSSKLFLLCLGSVLQKQRLLLPVS